MADVFTKIKRSEVMSRIRGRGNKETEVALMVFFRRYHVRGWRRNRKIFGRPDFVFPQIRLAVFVDGCFWHCCPKHGNQPRNNHSFWRTKLDRNKQRDRLVTRTLKQRGWQVMRIWEHELARKGEARLLRRIQQHCKIGPKICIKKPQ